MERVSCSPYLFDSLNFVGTLRPSFAKLDSRITMGVTMNCHASDSNNATGAIRKLLSGVVSISGATNSLAERRQATLDLLVEILSARFGIWSWGICCSYVCNIVTTASETERQSELIRRYRKACTFGRIKRRFPD